MAYKIEFTDQEKNKFNLIENENIRKSCMSVYMYLLKINDNINTSYDNANVKHLKDSNKLKISYRKFIDKYCRYHGKISIKTLKERMDKLKELGLIIIEVIKNTNVYSFCRFEGNTISNNNVNNTENVTCVRNTNIEADSNLPKYLNLKINYNYLYSNSTDGTNNYDIEQEKCSLDFILELAKESFKKMKVKSNYIKNKVIQKLNKYYNTIVKINALSYVTTIINNTREESNSNYNKYVGIKYNKIQQKPLRFCSYSGQREYDYAALERKLLGWDNKED